MDDELLAAIAAATAAAEAGDGDASEPQQSSVLEQTQAEAPAHIPSPEVKHESAEESLQAETSLKRPPSDDAGPHVAEQDDREHKRAKTTDHTEDPVSMDFDMADFQRMVSEAQAAAEQAGDESEAHFTLPAAATVVEQGKDQGDGAEQADEAQETDAAIQAILNGFTGELGDAADQDHFGPDVPTQPPAPVSSSIWSNQKHYARNKHALPSLRSIALDVIKALSEQPMEDTVNTLFDTETTEPGLAREYANLKSYFTGKFDPLLV